MLRSKPSSGHGVDVNLIEKTKQIFYTIININTIIKIEVLFYVIFSIVILIFEIKYGYAILMIVFILRRTRIRIKFDYN
jgi:hypothetical protein